MKYAAACSIRAALAFLIDALKAQPHASAFSTNEQGSGRQHILTIDGKLLGMRGKR